MQLSILDMGDGDPDDLFSPPWYVTSPNQQYLDKSVNYEAGSFWDRYFKVIFTIATSQSGMVKVMLRGASKIGQDILP